MKEEENKELDKILEELHVSVSERQNIAVINGESSILIFYVGLLTATGPSCQLIQKTNRLA